MRAVTLSSLAPKPGELLWDLGAGAGSISIECMRADVSCQAVAVERDAGRAARVARNAAALGVPRLQVVQKDSLESLSELDGEPDAIFIGGGVGAAGLLDAAWDRVKPGGRLVANAVTVEGEQALSQLRSKVGGELLRITIERAERTKGATFMNAMRTVTQFVGVKP